MTQNLAEISDRIRDAFAESWLDGYAYWSSLFADDIVGYHIPPNPADATPDDAQFDKENLDSKLKALQKLDWCTTVTSIHQLHDDTLVLEAVFTGKFPNGEPFRYPTIKLYTFRDGLIVRAIEIAQDQMMWDRLTQVSHDHGYDSSGYRLTH